MSTLAQLRQQAKVQYRDLSGVTVTDATWNDLLNEGYREMVAASPHWPFLESADASLVVLANTSSVTLPANGWRVLSVQNATDTVPMDELEPRRGAMDAYPDATTAGVPYRYRLFGNKLYVYPRPTVNTTLTVEYAGSPAQLSDGDSPVFPVQYHHAIKHYALEQALLADDEARAEQYGARWRRTLEQMRTDLLGARGDSYPTITDVGW